MAVLPTTYGEKVMLRIMHRRAASALGLAELGMSPAAEETFRARDRAALRRRARLRADRRGQDDDALRGAATS